MTRYFSLPASTSNLLLICCCTSLWTSAWSFAFHGRSVSPTTGSSGASHAGIAIYNTHKRRVRPLWNAAASGNINNDGDTIYDVAIIGSGPAACSLAALLTAPKSGASSSTGMIPNVVVVSKFADKRWVPNYGCWTEEWNMLDTLYAQHGVPGLLERGVDIKWEDTDVFFGEQSEGVFDTNNDEGSYRRTVGKDYVRLSREGLKSIFFGDDESSRNYNVIREDVMGHAVNTNVYLPSGSVVFHESHTELRLKDASQTTIRAKIVVDATGAESPFTIRDHRDQEGYQIAYGVECKVAGSGVTETRVGDYHRDKMTLFDFRSQEWRTDANEAKVIQQPTFNYVMPLSKDVIFFEETSLVANPAMSFQECKTRLIDRMASQNVQITEVLEEEYCYIPMGGGLPRKGQRIVPVGASSGLVHPSTGFQIGRALASNVDVATQILTELETGSAFDPDAAAARILGQIWTPESIKRRNFSILGGEFFMTLNVNELRRFFAGFFKLDPALWGAFLSQWEHLPGIEYQKDWLARLLFGLRALVKLPPDLALKMAAYIVTYSDLGPVIQSVTPLLGDPETYDKGLDFRENKGDVAAKDEAMKMLCGCDRCEDASAEGNRGSSKTRG